MSYSADIKFNHVSNDSYIAYICNISDVVTEYRLRPIYYNDDEINPPDAAVEWSYISYGNAIEPTIFG